ncbi:hypothetical protein I2486_12985 [Cellulophaga sp. E16_2]|uniref:hypothetical protein n=1 Tax=Cellulophaga sp. E16_2 TaxID=2789297 RepID=UPI001A9283EC|nr:hypothetical protein [Cellulophaga sp. E16_2]MBO0592316.1 hypothetical protein [Cellulophaga sp. E16_2]
MNQDLRNLFKETPEKEGYSLNYGHKERFANRLDQELPKKTIVPILFFMKIAATVLIMIGVGVYFYASNRVETMVENPSVVGLAEKSEIQEISLGDLSPDLKKVENYYLATINLELAKLEVSKENKGLVEGFMERLAELNKEYQGLNKELNAIGPNDQTISALIQNLQLRLQLLQKLKNKLTELKSSKNETAISI